MKKLPDDRGYFGDYGGRFVPETLMASLAELERAYRKAGHDRGFQARLDELLQHYVGRGSVPHRGAQDQQRHRPGSAGV